MRIISKTRFDALASYCRNPQIILFSEELQWFESGCGKIVATLLRDRTDNDFSVIILARDEKERFRWIDGTAFFPVPEQAIAQMHIKIDELLPILDVERLQGDARGRPVDFFKPVSPDKRRHEFFEILANTEAYSPSRAIIELMMRWYEDADGNFIEQFQTAGFDARIWELYLFAAFSEAGYAILRDEAIPDFTCSGLLGEFCVEATTVNPTQDQEGNLVSAPTITNDEDRVAITQNYLPIKFGGPLTSKLAKRYWERANVLGKPLIFAVQDFHAPALVPHLAESLEVYLYGWINERKIGNDHVLKVSARKINEHRWGNKVIPSGFFALPDSEHVSAVMFNSGATISKFNRMGVMTGFGSKRVRMWRQGNCVEANIRAPEYRFFVKYLDADLKSYQESWIEGMHVFHNPKAAHPLDPAMFNGAMHHRLLPNGVVEVLVPAWHPLHSKTAIMVNRL